MKTINATWEQRNLGVSCTEFVVEPNDKTDEAVKMICAHQDEYMVVKIPSGMVDMSLAIQEKGFRYIENNIQLSLCMKKEPMLPEPYARFADRIGCYCADPAMQQKVIRCIRQGDIFSTDKIALDPFFSQKQAGLRYAYWVEDVLQTDKVKILISTYQEEPIGFSIIIDKNTYYEGFLGGLFSDNIGIGLGLFWGYAINKWMYQAGIRKIRTGVSSNNPTVLRIHLQNHFVVESFASIYIKHELYLGAGKNV